MAKFTLFCLKTIWTWASKKGDPPAFPRLALPENPVQLDSDDKFDVPRRTRTVPEEDLPAFYQAVVLTRTSERNRMTRG